MSVPGLGGQPLNRTLVMGILNITPDSFSDGGLWLEPSAALKRAEDLVDQGADLIDIGGESTRPGAERVSAAEELERVVPVIEALAQAGVSVSVDTMRASVACAAIDAGACIVNDVSAGLADPEMLPAVAEAGVPYIAMHWRGHSATMNAHTDYDDVCAEVHAALEQRVQAALDAGIRPDHLVLDPGLGFAKEADHNWALLKALAQFQNLGFPLLIGASRKRFLGALLANSRGEPADMPLRDHGTAAISALCAAQKVWAVRVHEVAPSAAAVRVAQAWELGFAPQA